MQEPWDGPKIATTPSASWSQAAAEGGKEGAGISDGCYQGVGRIGGNDFSDPINTWNPLRVDD